MFLKTLCREVLMTSIFPFSTMFLYPVKNKCHHLTLYQTTNFKLKFVFTSVKNIEEKGENAAYQYFLLFP